MEYYIQYFQRFGTRPKPDITTTKIETLLFPICLLAAQIYSKQHHEYLTCRLKPPLWGFKAGYIIKKNEIS